VRPERYEETGLLSTALALPLFAGCTTFQRQNITYRRKLEATEEGRRGDKCNHTLHQNCLATLPASQTKLDFYSSIGDRSGARDYHIRIAFSTRTRLADLSTKRVLDHIDRARPAELPIQHMEADNPKRLSDDLFEE
jgi:hypothetical protein